MNDSNGKIRLLMKMTFKLQKDTHFVCKILFLKKNCQLSRRLKNYIKCMPEICQNVQKVDYQGAEGKSFFKIFKCGWALVLIDVSVVFQQCLKTIQSFEWDGNQNGIHQLVQATNNLKRSIKSIFWFQFMLMVIPCVFLNKQTEGIFHSSHSPRQVSSDKQQANCDMEPCFGFKTEGREV